MSENQFLRRDVSEWKRKNKKIKQDGAARQIALGLHQVHLWGVSQSSESIEIEIENFLSQIHIESEQKKKKF